MAKQTPEDIRTRSGNRKAVYTAVDTWTVMHSRIEGPPWAKSKLIPKWGTLGFTPKARCTILTSSGMSSTSWSALAAKKSKQGPAGAGPPLPRPYKKANRFLY